MSVITQRVLAKILSLRALNELRDGFAEEAASLTDRMVTDELDVVTDLVWPFVLKVFPDSLGLPPQDRGNLLTYGGISFNALGPRNDRFRTAMREADELAEWVAVHCSRLLEAVERECAGLPTGTLRVERFALRPLDATVDEAFTVELTFSGLELEVPADRRLLDVLFDAGVHVMTSCEEGTCGTCETAVLSGEPDHRDAVFTPEERDANDRIMVCVSRCRSSRLVLEL